MSTAAATPATGRKPRGSAPSHSEAIRVCCRVRPFSQAEQRSSKTSAWAVSFPPPDPAAGDSAEEVIVCRQPPPQQQQSGSGSGSGSGQADGGAATGRQGQEFRFAKVLRPESSQADVYECAASPIVEAVMGGYNGTIFAYGQTGSGKTHTMFGSMAASQRTHGRHAGTAQATTPQHRGRDEKAVAATHEGDTTHRGSTARKGGRRRPSSLLLPPTGDGETPTRAKNVETAFAPAAVEGRGGRIGTAEMNIDEEDRGKHRHRLLLSDDGEEAEHDGDDEEGAEGVVGPCVGGERQTSISADEKLWPGDRAAAASNRSSTTTDPATTLSTSNGASGSNLFVPQADAAVEGGLDEAAGIVPRAVHGIFDAIARADPGLLFEIRLFFVEVYMEQVRDLLANVGAAPAQPRRLRVRESVDSASFYVEGCEMPYATTAGEVLGLVKDGLARRVTHATRMNESSSRSHSILNITVTATHVESREATTGKLFLVDLAGSEKVGKTHATGLRLEEAKQINRSLSSLAMVTAALSDRATHVPYRDSVLTMILKDSLGGNARTALVTCCSPSLYNAAETLSTLRFGLRARNVCNKAVVNRQLSVEMLTRMLAGAEKEIARLRKALKEVKQSRGSKTPASEENSAAAANRRSSGSGSGSGDAEVSTARSTYSHDEEERLREKAALEVRVRALEADLVELQGTLRTAEESVGALTEEREDQRGRIARAEEEIRVWEEEHARLRLALRDEQRGRRAALRRARTYQSEIALLITQLESLLPPIRAARAAAAEEEELQLQQAREGPGGVAGLPAGGVTGMSAHRRRTLLALELSAQAAGRHHSDDNVDGPNVRLFDDSAMTAGGAAVESRGGPSGLSPSARPPQLPNGGDGDGSSGHRGTGGTALLGAGSSFGATSTSPVRFRRSTEPGHPQQRQPSDGGRGSASPGLLTPTMLSHQAALETAARDLVGIRAGRATGGGAVSDASLGSPPATGEAAIGPTQMDRWAAAGDGTHGDNGALSAAAARRIVELETALEDVEERHRAEVKAASVLRLDLQQAERKLSKRQERIDSLNLCLRHASDENAELHRILSSDRNAARSSLKRARSDVTYWRRKYEELNVERLQQQQQQQFSQASWGGMMARTIRGGGGGGGGTAAREGAATQQPPLSASWETAG